MNPIDLAIMIFPTVIAMAVGLYYQKHMRSVADFMAGGRAAGRYLLCTAKAEQGAGAAMFIGLFQVFNESGFVTMWWQQIGIFVTLLLAISGFIVYRYRQTRALTLAQFFEMRYSRNIRLFTGMLGFVAGILNFGIIPIIGARFFVYFLGLSSSFNICGFAVSTDLVLMAFLLMASATMVTVGGQVTVLVTSCLEGMFSQIGYTIVAVTLVATFSWTKIVTALSAQPVGKSMLNPFNSFQTKDFNVWWVLMALAFYAYGTMAWQNNHAFNSSAATAHDARMANVLGTWRQFSLTLITILLAAYAFTYLANPGDSANISALEQTLSQIPDASTVKQMRTPVALAYSLPVGIKGIVCAIILMGTISGDAMHLHSWSSIFLQDVIMPLRKKPLSIRKHLLFLRLGVICVAIFAYGFGAMFRQTEYVVMWFQVTTAIYVGGAGAVIIGGLYWSRGTTAGAWAGLMTGSFLCTAGIIMRQMDVRFPLNGTEISFYGAILAVFVYIMVSLFTCKKPYDMDRLLHRGVYAVESDRPNLGLPEQRPSWLARIMGIDQDFTKSDRFVTYAVFYWTTASFALVALGSFLYYLYPWPDQVWAEYWSVTAIWIPLLITLITTVWFTIGCVSDLKIFSQRLKNERIDLTDDGRVSIEENFKIIYDSPKPPA